jgi:hypothetical protein
MTDITCCEKPLDWKRANGLSWQNYVPEIAECGDCGTCFERRPESEVAYRFVGDTPYCTECDGLIVTTL